VSRFANILLDLDGTLTDPFDGIAASIRHAMQCMGLPPPLEDELKSAIGPPLRQGFSKFLATQDATRIESAMRFYRERYSVTGLFENRVYPGVPEMLAKLKAAGCRLFVATSKPAVFAQRVIRHFDLERYFVRTYGSELDGRFDNKVALLAMVLNREALDAQKTAMVGDRAQDTLAAKAHNLCAVGVTWGYGSRNELQESGANVLCNTPSEVVRFLTESGAAGSWGAPKSWRVP
jgi:phosphoglycolate phosphatase